MKFRDLGIEQGFDWVDDDNPANSFYLRCFKISPRRYRDAKGIVHTVGTINAQVFHVGKVPTCGFKTRYTDYRNPRLLVCEHSEPTVIDALNWLGSLPFVGGPNGPLSVKEILLDGVWRRDLFTVCDELGLVALTRRDGALFSGAAEETTTQGERA